MVQCRSILIGASAALAAVLSVSACSSSSTSSNTSTGTSSSAPASSAPATSSSTGATTAASGSPISIGVECSCTGAFGTTVSQAWVVLQAWGKSVNAAGGISGHPVKFTEEDNGSVAGTAATQVQGLVADKVSAIVDLDILDAVWQKTVDAAKIPVVGGNFSTPMFYTDANWYPAGQTNDSIVTSVAAVAKQAGATNLADLYCAESVQCQESVPLIKAAGAKAGTPVVYTASISATAPNYTAQCLAAKDAGVKAIFIGDGLQVIAKVATDCDQQGYDPIYVTEGTGYQSFAETTPGLKDNLWSPFPILPYYSTNPAVTAMNTAVDKYFPGTTTNVNSWSEFAVQAWTAALLLQQALKNADVTASTTVTPAVFTTGLSKVSNETLGGFTPSLSFTGATHSVDCWYVGRVTGGKASQVGGETCEK